MSHTPGPWRLVIESPADAFRNASYRILAGETDLLGNVDDPWYPNIPDKIDDARLIAAAPELLAALKALLSFDDVRGACDMGPMDEGWKSDELGRAFADADAAIAKAEGK